MVGSAGSTVSYAKFTSIISNNSATPVPPQKRARRNKKYNVDQNNTSGIDENIERKEVQASCVRAQYNLVYLTRLQKCFSTNSGVVYLYVKKGYPLVFDVKIGTLGSLRAVLMFRNEDEEDDDLNVNFTN
jgi:hypothetical protein